MKEAETKEISIKANDSDIVIFQKSVSAFSLPWAAPAAFTNDSDVLAVINALLATIRYECREKEKEDHTVGNLEAQLSANLKTFQELKERNDDLELRNKENQRSTKELMKQFQQTKKKADELSRQNKTLLHQNKHQAEVITRLQKLHFGTKSEKTESLQDQEPDDNEDPLDEEADPEGKDIDEGDGNQHKNQYGSRGRHHHKHGKKKKGKRKKDLSKLPVQEIYDFDFDQYDKDFGAGNWNILFWKKSETVEATRTVTYLKKVFKPVIEYGKGAERTLKTMGTDDPFMPDSFAGRSLVASMMCDRFTYYVPAYRMEQDSSRYGFTISRQDITNWFKVCGLNFFQPVYKYMKQKLAGYKVQQCDETTWLIIKDGRKPGTKSYCWVHCSSELDIDHPPIIIYEMELTRKEEHLEKFFSKQIIAGDVSIKLCSDAYGGYEMLHRLYPEIFTCCHCMSHCRRRFANALNILKKVRKGQDISESPEWKVVELLVKIFDIEDKLDNVSTAKRLKARQEKSKPLMEGLFTYLKGLDLTDPAYSETLIDAVNYALGHEEELCQFLNDGNVPIDNNFCERCVKNIAISRKNSLFSYSRDGAKATAIITSMVRTSAANGADPYYYLLYLLTKMPKKYYSGKADEDLETMMPWSSEYKQFEKKEKQKLIDRAAPPGNEKPVSPRKKGKTKQQSDYPILVTPSPFIFSKNIYPFTSGNINPLPMPF